MKSSRTVSLLSAAPTDDALVGNVCLVVAILVMTAQNSFFSLLVSSSPEFTQCDVVFCGNILGVSLLMPLFRDHLTPAKWRSVKPREWKALILSSFLYSSVAPFFYFAAVRIAGVATVAIVQRLESVDLLVLSSLFLGTDISRWTLINGLITVVGIVMSVVSPVFWGEKVELTTGNVLALIGGLCNSSSLVICRRYLLGVPIGVLAVFRLIVGSFLYLLLAWATGSDFGPISSIQLWTSPHLLLFGFAFVTIMQFTWLKALMCKGMSPVVLSVAMTLMFPLNLFWSALILSKPPTSQQWVGAAIISVSLMSSLVQALHRPGVTLDDEDSLHTFLHSPTAVHNIAEPCSPFFPSPKSDGGYVSQVVMSIDDVDDLDDPKPGYMWLPGDAEPAPNGQ